MKISIIMTNFAFEKMDGIGNFAVRTIYNLVSQPEVLEVMVYVEKKNKIYLERESFYFSSKLIIKCYALPSNRILRSLKKLFIAPHPLFCKSHEILYVAPPVSLFSLLASRVIAVVHDLTPLKVSRSQSIWFRMYFYVCLSLIAVFAKRIPCVSKSTAEDFIKFFPFAKRKTFVSYNTIPDTQEDKCLANAAEKFFLIVSTIQPGKNIENSIKAFAHFSNSSVDTFKLIVVGKHGWGGRELYDIPEKMGIAHLVEFMGYIDKSSLNKLYMSAWAVLNLSFYEGFGLSILEAMRYGCPSVVSNTSSLPEVAGLSGLAVDPYKIIEISNALSNISEPHKRLELSQRIPFELERFLPRRNICKLVGIE